MSMSLRNAYFIEDLVYGHFSSALGSAPYLYQQRFLKHLSDVFDAMTDFVQVALLV